MGELNASMPKPVSENRRQASINKKVFQELCQAWGSGSRIQWICVVPYVNPDQWKEIIDLILLAIMHYGEEADCAFGAGGPRGCHPSRESRDENPAEGGVGATP